MKQIVKQASIIALLCLVGNILKSQVSGVVYADYNSNGTRDFLYQLSPYRYYNEIGPADVQVKAFNEAGFQIGPTKIIDTTGSYAGTYSFSAAEIPPGTKVRIEFGNLPVGYLHSFTATTGNRPNRSNVQFVTAPATNIDFAICNPWDYWNQNTDPNPVLMVTASRRGKLTGLNAKRFTVLSIDNDYSDNNVIAADNIAVGVDTGNTVAARRAAVYDQTGSTFGIAVQNRTQRAFVAASLKRGYALGPQGAGGIYFFGKATPTNRYMQYQGGFTLEGVTPSNGGAALNFGTVTRVVAANPDLMTNAEINNDNYLASVFRYWNPGHPSGDPSNGDISRDIDAFAKVGKMAYGNIVADKVSQKLYCINLFQRRLIVLDLGAVPSATLNNATAATIAPFVKAYDLLSITGFPQDNATGIIRPYGLTVNRGIVYVGWVRDASISGKRGDLIGGVIRVIPSGSNTGTAADFTASNTGTPNIEFQKYDNYYKNTSGYAGQAVQMNPWTDSWAVAKQKFNDSASAGEPRYFPQPMISGLEVNEDLSVDISIRDRWGDQGCNFEYTAISGSSVTSQTFSFGDVLHWFRNADGSYSIEDPARIPAGNLVELRPSSVFAGAGSIPDVNSFGQGSSFGRSNKEFYADRAGDGTPENGTGGVAKLFGTLDHVRTAVDPSPNGLDVRIVADGGHADKYYATHGVVFNDVTKGFKSNYARLIGNSESNKSAALGDLEFVIDPQPIQVGNRIWLDDNGNGIQDAGETRPLGLPAGTQMILRGYGVDDTRFTADDRFYSATVNADGTYYFDALYETDPRAPNIWQRMQNQIVPGFKYSLEIVIPKSTGYDLAPRDVSGNGLDAIDSDFTRTEDATNIYANLEIVPTQSNHNFDLGLIATASLGDKVWRDDNKDGIQDSAEPGIAGVTVMLYQNGADGIPGNADDVVVGSTKSDAYGNYLFNNLPVSTNNSTRYNVGFVLPPNYQFTTNTNQANGTGVDSTITLSGGATAANGSDANAANGRTGSYYLRAGQNERGVDAGVIFKEPAAISSIGDKVFLDEGASPNGIQDATEPGIANVTVTLLKETSPGSGVYVNYMTTITDSKGNYLFNDLPNANYKVQVSSPPGMLFTTKDVGANDAIDSDVDPTTGLTAVVNIAAAGTKITTVDAGLKVQPVGRCAIGDRVWNDLNRNGLQDVGEPGIANVTVNLYRYVAGVQTPAGTTTTDVNGNYLFPDLAPGGYRAEFAAIGGMTRTSNTAGVTLIDDAKDSDAFIGNGLTPWYELVAGERNMSVDAGYHLTAAANTVGGLGDKVWNDINGDGIQNVGEPGVPGIQVTLYDNMGNVAAITSTDNEGNYLFPDLPAGNTYTLGFGNLPDGFTFVNHDAGADGVDSDVTPSTGRTGTYTIVGGTTNTTIDAGIREVKPSGKGSLGNRVWYDLDSDGLQDSGEIGVAGVLVELYRDANNDGVINAAELTTPFATTRTNSLGEYLFPDLDKGNYQVSFGTLPAGFTITNASQGGDRSADSDGGTLDVPTQKSFTPIYALAAGEDNLTVDLGLIPPANTNTLGDKVWYDLDSDGIQDGGAERGVPGVMVSLYNNAGVVVARTTTDENGEYMFVGLANGNYSVGFSNLPAGFELTNTTEGTSTGSDANTLTGRTNNVTLGAANRNERSLDAGIRTTKAALGDRVWLDNDDDGVQDTGEPGVAGVTVTLFASGGTVPLATCVTDANGNYFFANLDAGAYELEFGTGPSGTVFARQNTPGDNGNNTNSDAVPTIYSSTTARTGVITLSVGEVDSTIDAGLRVRQPAKIGNYVWTDLNNNGQQDTNEPGVAGFLVTLFDAANDPIGTAVTDGNGFWEIGNVPPGTGYYCVFGPNLPAFDVSGAPGTNPAYTSGGADGPGTLSNGSESNTDSDVAISGGTAGRTGVFNILPGNNFPNIDAGVINWAAVNALPIQLIDFNANIVSSSVNVGWKVAAESDVLTYEVEHSINGVRFSNIGNKQATKAGQYQFFHANPAKGINYYRLRVIEANGKTYYSPIAAVSFGNEKSEITIFPNPAVDELTIRLNPELFGKQVAISVYTMRGRLLNSRLSASAQPIEKVDTKALPGGSYILEINNNGVKTSKVFQVIRK